ncbi:MAG TPA: hypothetical protein VFQ45_21075 [Longimicrobium sp.]|nr:hypothetical protein [Longimicrobium sp.]
MDASEREEARKDYKAAITGFGLALVWLAIVTAVSYGIAKMM